MLLVLPRFPVDVICSGVQMLCLRVLTFAYMRLHHVRLEQKMLCANMQNDQANWNLLVLNGQYQGMLNLVNRADTGRTTDFKMKPSKLVQKWAQTNPKPSFFWAS